MRYLVFGGDIDNPQGGLSDLLYIRTELEDAIETAESFVESDRAVNWVEVYDTEAGITVYERG